MQKSRSLISPGFIILRRYYAYLRSISPPILSVETIRLFECESHHLPYFACTMASSHLTPGRKKRHDQESNVYQNRANHAMCFSWEEPFEHCCIGNLYLVILEMFSEIVLAFRSIVTISPAHLSRFAVTKTTVHLPDRGPSSNRPSQQFFF
jgi:hypothetical protein